MSDTEAALKALGAFPIVQAAVGILIIFGGYWLIAKGMKDGKNGSTPPTNGSVIPQWTMMVHDIAEQSRTTNRILDEMHGSMGEIAKEQREQTQLLEDIRNNQALRADPAYVPKRR